VSEVSPGHLKFKFQRLLKKCFYWQRAAQLYGPPYIDIASRLDELGIKPQTLVTSRYPDIAYGDIA
jgi:hypothetical protein